MFLAGLIAVLLFLCGLLIGIHRGGKTRTLEPLSDGPTFLTVWATAAHVKEQLVLPEHLLLI